MKQDHYVSALTAFRGFGGTSRLQFLNLHVQPFFFSIPPSSVRYRHIKQTKKSTHKGSDVTAQHAHGIHSLSLIFFFLWFTRIFFDHEMRTKKIMAPLIWKNEKGGRSPSEENIWGGEGKVWLEGKLKWERRKKPISACMNDGRPGSWQLTLQLDAVMVTGSGMEWGEMLYERQSNNTYDRCRFWKWQILRSIKCKINIHTHRHAYNVAVMYKYRPTFCSPACRGERSRYITNQ